MQTNVNSVLVAALFSGATVFAQRQADVTIPFSQDIQQIVLNPVNGHVIVKEKEVISDYNPETRKTEWVINKKDVVTVGALEGAQKVLDAVESVDGLAASFQSADDIYFVQGSLYVRAVLENRDVIINSLTGQVVFNSETAGYRILQSQFLPEANEFLLLTSEGKFFYSVLWNQDGKEKWKTEIGTAASLASAFKDALSFKKTGSEDKAELKGDAIYTSVNGILYKLDKQTGKILWQAKDKIYTFYLSQSGKNVIVIKNVGSIISMKQGLNVWNSQDGSQVWKNDIKTLSVLYLEDWADKILVAHSSGFNFYNYADGKKVWKKDAFGFDFKRVIPIGQDYLYVGGVEINLVDGNGQKKWKKPAKISDKREAPIHFFDIIGDNQVLYLSGVSGILVDYTTGKKIWKKDIEFEKDRPVLYAIDDAINTVLVYNDKKVYKFDTKTTATPKPLAKLKKVKNEESISDIGLFDWGISLVGEGDVIGIGLDGAVKYQNAYTEPGGSTRKLMKVAAFGLKDYSKGTQAQTHYSFRDGAGKVIEGTAEFSDKIQQTGKAAGVASDLLNRSGIANRFSAMKANGDYAFVLSKGTNGAELVKVKKADGSEVDKIALDNNKPIYEVDPVNDNVYYVFKNELRTYNGK
ncbi:hypothetical protein SAMD00024442_11_28 [Candidatus Symbiothrix dinenymphae]|nr:hypothetical protein SAMD00024442_11_28 [Candidatus Symbiothrix dinenymphae]